MKTFSFRTLVTYLYMGSKCLFICLSTFKHLDKPSPASIEFKDASDEPYSVLESDPHTLSIWPCNTEN